MTLKFNPPNEITIESKTYPLQYLYTVAHNYYSAYLMIDKKPIVSIEYYCEQPNDISLRRAILAIDSYRYSGGKYAVIADMSVTSEQDIQLPFTVDMLDRKKSNIDLFEFFGTPHLIIEAKEGIPYYRYAIYDQDLVADNLISGVCNGA
jgi:hypothetical protein